MSALFVTPIIVDIQGHRFVINSQEYWFSFLNRSIPLFPKKKIILKPKEQRLVKVEAPFIDEISGLATVKILDKLMQSTMMLNLKFT